MRHVRSKVDVPRLTDEQLAEFLNVPVRAVGRLTTAKRRAYEALHDAERRIKAWQAGEADKPTDILIDGER